MSAVYRLKASELDRNFLEEIKATFGDKEIEIIIAEFDKTEYLLKSESNKNKLLQAIENVKEGQNLVEVNLQDVQLAEELSLNHLLLPTLTSGPN
jgi:antitoxin YefM